MDVTGESEAELVRQAKEGNPEAWDLLLKKHQAPVCAYLFQLVHDQQTALDLVQETFVAALRWIGTLKEDARFTGWLYRIAHQKVVQTWRRSGIETACQAKETFEPDHADDSPRDLLIADEERALLLGLLRELPVVQRSVLLLHYLEDFSVEEIARITGVGIGTVKSRLHYARKAMRDLWRKENEKTHS